MRSVFMSSLRIEAIDNYHPSWPSVMETVGQLGFLEELNLDSEGWLPARQVLLAGFFQTQVAGFICFSIVPKIQHGAVGLMAQVESIGVRSDYAYDAVERELLHAAEQRSRGLKCQAVISKAA